LYISYNFIVSAFVGSTILKFSLTVPLLYQLCLLVLVSAALTESHIMFHKPIFDYYYTSIIHDWKLKVSIVQLCWGEERLYILFNVSNQFWYLNYWWFAHDLFFLLNCEIYMPICFLYAEFKGVKFSGILPELPAIEISTRLLEILA